MGLFQRNEFGNEGNGLYQIVNDVGNFSTGQNKTLLIVGLGNIGDEYDGTRHNIGFAVIDYFADKHDFPAWSLKKDLKCHETSKNIGTYKVILIKPTTFMNLSGEALASVQRFYKLDNTTTLAIYDEVDISFGQLRTRIGGGAAGHNGVKSLIQHCGEDFGRLRIGIGPKKPAQMELSDFVLGKFGTTHTKQLPNLLLETNSLLSEYCFGGGQLLEETRTFIV